MLGEGVSWVGDRGKGMGEVLNWWRSIFMWV